MFGPPHSFQVSEQNGLSAWHLRRLRPPAGHWAKCGPVGGLAFGDWDRRTLNNQESQDESFRPNLKYRES